MSYTSGDTYSFTSLPAVYFSVSPGQPQNIKWWGAAGDSSTDDTFAIQTAVCSARGYLGGPDGGDLFFPIGNYKITNTIYAQAFAIGAPIKFIGEYSGFDVQAASAINWNGPNGGVMWKMWNQTGGRLENLTFNGSSASDGVSGCLTCLYIEEDEFSTLGGSATDTFTIEGCSFNSPVGNGSSGIRLGNGTVYDVSQVYINRCMFLPALDGYGNPTNDYHIRLDGPANTKDFFITDCNYSCGRLAFIYCNINGVLNVRGCVGGGNPGPSVDAGQIGDFYIVAVENAVIESCESEGTCRLLYSPSTGGNYNAIMLKGNNWNGGSLHDHSGVAANDGKGNVATFAAVDVVIYCANNMQLEGNTFNNSGRAPKIVVDTDAIGSTSSSLISLNNFYPIATSLPLYVDNGALPFNDNYGRNFPMSIVSRHDSGGNGSIIFPSIEGKAIQINDQQLFKDTTSAATTIVTEGDLNCSIARYDLDWTNVPAGSSFSPVIFTLPFRSRILNVTCKTTQAWSGLGLTNVTLMVGTGDDTDDYIVSHDVTLPVTKGILNADMGTSLNTSATNAWGSLHNSTTAGLENSDSVYVTLTAGTGNLSSINAGHTEIHVTYQVLPGQQLFMPSDIPGCKLWLRADQGVTLNSTTVSEWDDMSGNGNNFVQATSANQPLYVVNAYEGNDGKFKPALRGGSTVEISDTSFALASPATIVLIFTKNPSGNVYYADYNGSTAVIFGGFGFADLAWLNGSDEYVIAATGTLSAGVPHLVIITQKDTATTNVSAYLDLAVSPVFSHTPLTAFTSAPQNLFAITDSGDFLEYIAYNRVLTAAEIQALQAYAQKFWGV